MWSALEAFLLRSTIARHLCVRLRLREVAIGLRQRASRGGRFVAPTCGVLQVVRSFTHGFTSSLLELPLSRPLFELCFLAVFVHE